MIHCKIEKIYYFEFFSIYFQILYLNCNVMTQIFCFFKPVVYFINIIIVFYLTLYISVELKKVKEKGILAN